MAPEVEEAEQLALEVVVVGVVEEVHDPVEEVEVDGDEGEPGVAAVVVYHETCAVAVTSIDHPHLTTGVVAGPVGS